MWPFKSSSNDSGSGRAKPAQSQQSVCAEFGAAFVLPHPDSKAGIAVGTLQTLPLNALRHPVQNGTCGWYIWGGELTDAVDFQPYCVHHISDHCPSLIPYLALAPGWRVLLAPGQTEVWYDAALLNV